MDSVRAAYPLFHAEGSGSIPTSTLQLDVHEISVDRARRLNSEWHSVLPDTFLGNLVGTPRCAFYGARCSGQFYAVGIWASPIAANRLTDGDRILELRRFVIASDAPKNTASRVLAIMRQKLRTKYPELLRLISYQAVDHHKGTIYKAAGWKAVAESEYMRWHPTENRAEPQTISRKIRWEIAI